MPSCIIDDKTSTFDQIKERFDAWFSNILSNQLEEFYTVVNTIRNYFYGILNYFRYGMTNAIAEGFNTKINIIKRRAYGFQDLEYFMLKMNYPTAPRGGVKTKSTKAHSKDLPKTGEEPKKESKTLY